MTGTDEFTLQSRCVAPRHGRAFAVLLAFVAGACAPVQTPVSGTARAPATQVSKLMEEALVPGLQIAIIDNGEIEVLPYGVADVQSRVPVTRDTVFEAASLSKPVFAYGVLLLANEGRIDLDKPIGHYLQDLTPLLANLTARQLLSHSAGLPNSPFKAEALSIEAQSPSRFSYSGEGYGLLQRVVERITGQPIQEYMQRAVFEPLGMTSSSYVWRDDYAKRKAFSHGYTGSSAGRSRIPEAKVASSLETTAGDYARFLVAAVQGRGLSQNVASDFLRPQVALEEGCVTCLGKPRGATSTGRHWALGFGRERAGARDFVWHWGDNNQTAQSYAAIDTSADRGIVILANSGNGHSIAREIATTVLGVDAPGYAWIDSYPPHTEPSRRLLSKIVRGGVASLNSPDLAVPRQDALRVAERLVGGGRANQAAELLRRIMGPAEATAAEFALLAEAERKASNLSAARTAATTALRLEPANSQAKQVLTRIEQAERVIPAERLARYAGTYSSPFGELEIRTDGRRLTAMLVDQPPSDMLPLSDRAFLMESMGVPIEFVEGDGGAVTHAVVRAGGDIKLPRIRRK